MPPVGARWPGPAVSPVHPAGRSVRCRLIDGGQRRVGGGGGARRRAGGAAGCGRVVLGDARNRRHRPPPGPGAPPGRSSSRSARPAPEPEDVTGWDAARTHPRRRRTAGRRRAGLACGGGRSGRIGGGGWMARHQVRRRGRRSSASPSRRRAAAAARRRRSCGSGRTGSSWARRCREGAVRRRCQRPRRRLRPRPLQRLAGEQLELRLLRPWVPLVPCAGRVRRRPARCRPRPRQHAAARVSANFGFFAVRLVRRWCGRGCGGGPATTVPAAAASAACGCDGGRTSLRPALRSAQLRSGDAVPAAADPAACSCLRVRATSASSPGRLGSRLRRGLRLRRRSEHLRSGGAPREPAAACGSGRTSASSPGWLGAAGATGGAMPAAASSGGQAPEVLWPHDRS